MLSHIVYPMAALVLLTFLVLAVLFMRRLRSVKSDDVKISFYKIYQGENTEPRATAQASRHYVNLFEVPVLFYAACLTALATNSAGTTMVLLAWLFVAARVAHAIVHLGGNRIPPRIAAYAAGWLILLAMWAMLVATVTGIG